MGMLQKKLQCCRRCLYGVYNAAVGVYTKKNLCGWRWIITIGNCIYGVHTALGTYRQCIETQYNQSQRHTEACKLFYNNDLHPLGSVRTPYRCLQTLQYNDKMSLQKLPLSTYYQLLYKVNENALPNNTSLLLYKHTACYRQAQTSLIITQKYAKT